MRVETFPRGATPRVGPCRRARAGAAGALLLSAAVLPGHAAAQQAPGSPGPSTPGVRVVEATIADLHEAILAGRTSAVEIVQAHLHRIEAYDRRGPSLNALTVVHPGALDRARELDEAFAATGRLVGPLHGIPILVKDNYDTFDLPTTAGSRSLSGALPVEDAFMVARLREAGAVILAKTNMAEFAFSPYETIGSTLPGHTFNPYALNRVPAGSSGGTAAAVAASLGVAGLGTDTGNSIRGPSSHTALVGIRPTIGLTSRHGIVPLYLERDVGGPMARSVEDAARLLDVLAGEDPRDPATAGAAERIPPSYTDFLDREALRGARLGIVRPIVEREGGDPEIRARFEEAVRVLEAAGATVIDLAEVPVLEQRVPLCSSFRRDLEAYLETRPGLPRTLDEILEGGEFNPGIEPRLRTLARDSLGGDPARCEASAEGRSRFREGLRALLREHRLDALIHPTWANPPRLVGDLTSPHGDNNQVLAPSSGFPAITVPMGWVARGMLPVGLQFLGDAWSEPRLIALAHAFEQATRHRRPPATTPELVGGSPGGR